MKVRGTVFRYKSDVDTDVIIPARYLNTTSEAELASHCMEDIDKDFVKKVKKGDIIVAEDNFGCGSSREQAQARQRQKEYPEGAVHLPHARGQRREYDGDPAADDCGGDHGVFPSAYLFHMRSSAGPCRLVPGSERLYFACFALMDAIRPPLSMMF